MMQSLPQLKAKKYRTVREDTVIGLRAVAFMKHGTTTQVQIKTPVGQTYRSDCTFIGFDGEKRLFFSLPTENLNQVNQFFIEGYRLAVDAVSDEGEGAKVRFASKISTVLKAPVNLVVVELPQQAKLIQQRKDNRYELNVKGEVPLGNRRLSVNLTDISAGGCGFSFDAIAPVFEKHHQIAIQIQAPDSDDCFVLSGQVENRQQKWGMQRYGVSFDRGGLKHCEALIKRLVYDGSHYIFNPHTEDAK
ncbi:flagellar brake protein [Salinivibrio sp. IB643]|jgi:PilZ domain.|uniref:flagellar brake protein n=1 Tax=Salinivibrio TaxID=51366 RepID=UPI00098904A4|nr:PilZ domain-containing protein [Salinivibrio sp. IB643]